MRLKNFIIILTSITLFSLSYIWQQIEIIKLAYHQNQKNKIYKELLDKNHYLRYNLVSLKSSFNLGAKLFNNDDTKFEIPKSTQMRVVILPEEEATIKTQDMFIKDGILLSVFKIREAWPISVIKSYIDKQAQAQDILTK